MLAATSPWHEITAVCFMTSEAFQGVSINVIYCLGTCQICAKKKLVLLKEKSSNKSIFLYWLSIPKKKKNLSLCGNTGHEGSKTSNT